MKSTKLCLFIGMVLSCHIHGAIPDTAELPLVKSITRDGITWEFDKEVRVGRFINGDYYVVGTATVVDIDPLPDEGRNGSVLNIPLDAAVSGFDDRVNSNRFREELRVYPPIKLSPGDALISSISIDSIGSVRCVLRSSDVPPSPVKSVSVLTSLQRPVSDDAFRPSYGDREQKLFYANDINRNLLPRLQRVGSEPEITEFSEYFRRPWMDVCFYSFDAAVEYQPAYGRELGRATGMAALLLALDYSWAEKEALLIGFVQYAVDLWGLVRNGYDGWPAHGGHGNGRKLPLVISGMLLGDNEMASPTKSYPDLKFGEDMQTMYDTAWTGASVVYAGHMGVYKGEVVSDKEGWGPYEHLHPSEWPNNTGESYRRCCTSISWIGQALAARLFGAVDNWSHPAFFDYCDRWMTEDDSAHVAVIKDAKGWDYSANYARQGQAWDTFVEKMWSAYRFSDANIKQNRRPAHLRTGSVFKGGKILTELGRGRVLSRISSEVHANKYLHIYTPRGEKLLTLSPKQVKNVAQSGLSLPAGVLIIKTE